MKHKTDRRSFIKSTCTLATGAFILPAYKYNPDLLKKINIKVAAYNIACAQWTTPEKVGEEFKKYNLDIFLLNEFPKIFPEEKSGKDWDERLAEILNLPYYYTGNISSANHGISRETAYGRWKDISDRYGGKFKTILSKTPLTDTKEYPLTGGRWNPAGTVRAVTIIQGVKIAFHSLHTNTHWEGLFDIFNNKEKEFHVIAGGDWNHSNYEPFEKGTSMRDGRWDVNGPRTIDKIMYRDNGKIKCIKNFTKAPIPKMSDHHYAYSEFEILPVI